MKVQEKTRKYLLIVVTSIVFLSSTGCANIFSPPMETNLFDDWTVFKSQIRDVLILDNGSIIISNSAPRIGVGPDNGKPYIVAFNPQTNKIIWQLEYAPVAPISANHQKMFVLEERQLVAVDLEQGDEKWNIPFDAVGFNQMFSDEDLVLVASDQILYAFNSQNGRLQWTSDTRLRFDISIPDPTDFTSWRQHNALTKYGHVVFARKMISKNAKECQISVAALNAENGIEIWQRSFSLPMVSEGCLPGILPLTFDDDVVLIGVLESSFKNCTLNAFDINTGEIGWKHTNLEGCSTSSSFVFSGGKILAVTSTDILILDTQDGRLITRQSLPLGGLHGLILPKGLIAARSRDHNQNLFQVMDLQDNKIYEYKLSLPKECNSQTEIAGATDEQIIFLNGNCIQSINISDGKLITK